MTKEVRNQRRVVKLGTRTRTSMHHEAVINLHLLFFDTLFKHKISL